ncbi:MAG TPA: hypothetical protein VEV16_10555 [Daejeonella sp.]|nr:hypothetical protein [Daejeonella sp.]
MKNSNSSICLFGIGLSTLLGCKKAQDEGCYQKYPTVKTARNVEGRMSILDSKYPEIWSIKVDGSIGGQGYDSQDAVVIPCNIPENLKKEGLRVIFSGQAKSTDRDSKKNAYPLWFWDVYYLDQSEIKILNSSY